MKNLYLTLVSAMLLSGLFSGSTLAAENNWTGFYLGGNLGYANGDSDSKVELGGLWSGQSQALQEFIINNSQDNKNPVV